MRALGNDCTDLDEPRPPAPATAADAMVDESSEIPPKPGDRRITRHISISLPDGTTMARAIHVVGDRLPVLQQFVAQQFGGMDSAAAGRLGKRKPGRPPTINRARGAATGARRGGARGTGSKGKYGVLASGPVLQDADVDREATAKGSGGVVRVGAGWGGIEWGEVGSGGGVCVCVCVCGR